MDAGFEKDVKFIVEALEEARHTTNKVRRRTNVLVSATLTPDVQRLAKVRAGLACLALPTKNAGSLSRLRSHPDLPW
jgi:superfamily II DNA/RNA helicase